MLANSRLVVDVFMHSHYLDQALPPSIIRALSVLKLAYRNHAELKKKKNTMHAVNTAT